MATVQCKKTSSESRFEVGDEFSDVTLVVQNRKLHVNKNLLMIHSPVFHKMFTADFKEKESSEIPLPGKQYSTMLELLDQIYPGNGADLLKDDTLDDLLQLADEYDVQQVFTNCIQYINNSLFLNCSGNKPPTDLILFYLGLVERYQKMQSLRDKMIYRASQIPTRDIMKSKFFLLVPATATRDALLKRLLEYDVF